MRRHRSLAQLAADVKRYAAAHPKGISKRQRDLIVKNVTHPATNLVAAAKFATQGMPVQETATRLAHPMQVARSAILSTPSGKAASDILRDLRQGGMQELAHRVEDELLGAAGAKFAVDVARYATGRAGWRDLIANAGPVGRVVSFLAGEASNLGSSSTNDIQNAIKLLEQSGYTVEPPEEAPTEPPGGSHDIGPPSSYPATGGGTAAQTQAGGPKLPIGTFPGGLYVPMTAVSSSNVYAIGYREDSLTMRVQYLAPSVSANAIHGRGHQGDNKLTGSLGHTVLKQRSGPGPVYDYHGVSKHVFLKVLNAGSVGGAIWDQLRVRGTVYGHKFDYELVAASMANVLSMTDLPGGGTKFTKVGHLTYVPRKAVGPNQFSSRSIKQGNRVFQSILPEVGMSI